MKADKLEDLTEDTPEVTPAREPDKLDLAIEEFYNEESKLTISEKISNLRNAYMWTSLNAMKRIKQHGTKSPISAEEEYKQTEGLKQFKLFEKMYESELKSAKLQGKKTEDLDTNWLKDIKNAKSTIGSIVRNMNEKVA